jgi:hypothetical protein
MLGARDMRRIFAALPLLLVVSCVEAGPSSGVLSGNSGPLSGKYEGADAGYLVVALAAKAGTSYDSYTLMFRSKDRSAQGRVWWGQGNMFDRRKLDVDDGKEKGIVDVRRLPPGDYEIFNFNVFMNGGTIQKSWRSAQDFSIPFTIAPGRAAYIGEFMAVKVMGENIFGMSLLDGAYFVLSDKADRDVGAVKEREPGLSEVTNAVVDANTVGNPLIRATLR